MYNAGACGHRRLVRLVLVEFVQGARLKGLLATHALLLNPGAPSSLIFHKLLIRSQKQLHISAARLMCELAFVLLVLSHVSPIKHTRTSVELGASCHATPHQPTWKWQKFHTAGQLLLLLPFLLSLGPKKKCSSTGNIVFWSMHYVNNTDYKPEPFDCLSSYT